MSTTVWQLRSTQRLRTSVQRGAVILTTLLVGCAAPPYRCVDRSSIPEVPTEISVGDERTFFVDAKLPWNRSGVRVSAGQMYQISVGASDPPWMDWFIPATPESGWSPWWQPLGEVLRSAARVPTAKMSALVCSAGQEDGNALPVGEIDGRPFPSSGELLCFANDWAGHYDNNRGCVPVTMRRLEP